MVNISKEQLANLVRYSNFRMNESMISIILEYLDENSLDYGKNGSYVYLLNFYKNNEFEALKSALNDEIIFLKKLKKDLTLNGEEFSKDFKIYDLLDSIFTKINKFQD